MDTGTLTSNLGHLDFDQDSDTIGRISLPDSLPSSGDYKQLPKDILKSSTVENLLSQNEDLMARLKVALRRLSILENDNRKLADELSKAQAPQSSITLENLISQNEDLMARLKVSMRRLSLLEVENQNLTEELGKLRTTETARSDELLVLQEKGNSWRKRIDDLEDENQRISSELHRIKTSETAQGDQILILKERDKAWKQKYSELNDAYKEQNQGFIDLQKKYQSAFSEISRHTKYHERIKNHVKPYISQLKEYSKAQEVKISEMEKSLTGKDFLIKDLRHQIIEVTKNSKLQIETTEKNTQEMVQFYEDQIISLRNEVARLKKNQEELETKSIRLNSALERQDTLENEVVTLRRSKDDLKGRLELEIEKQREKMSELIKQNQKLGVEHADLQIRVVDDQNRIKSLETENFQMKEQLESLRFMWSSKNEEHERLKTAADALERLNKELSMKLNQVRTKEGS